MKKLLIIILALTTYSCVVPLSIGNKSLEEVDNDKTSDSNTVYTKNKNAMVAINYILPHNVKLPD